MTLGERIKMVRERKELSQKEVALSCKMDTGNYSRIENDKTDPAFSSVEKIAKALGITLDELFRDDATYTEVNSADKTLMEKLALIEQLDKKDKQAFFTVLDAFVGRKKLKNTLGSVLKDVK
jgi:transcriptional regulator with XRE-family HTH domain